LYESRARTESGPESLFASVSQRDGVFDVTRWIQPDDNKGAVVRFKFAPFHFISFLRRRSCIFVFKGK
jgi:hypothetical protein